MNVNEQHGSVVSCTVCSCIGIRVSMEPRHEANLDIPNSKCTICGSSLATEQPQSGGNHRCKTYREIPRSLRSCSFDYSTVNPANPRCMYIYIYICVYTHTWRTFAESHGMIFNARKLSLWNSGNRIDRESILERRRHAKRLPELNFIISTPGEFYCRPRLDWNQLQFGDFDLHYTTWDRVPCIFWSPRVLISPYTVQFSFAPWERLPLFFIHSSVVDGRKLRIIIIGLVRSTDVCIKPNSFFPILLPLPLFFSFPTRFLFLSTTLIACQLGEPHTYVSWSTNREICSPITIFLLPRVRLSCLFFIIVRFRF